MTGLVLKMPMMSYHQTANEVYGENRFFSIEIQPKKYNSPAIQCYWEGIQTFPE